MNVTFRQLSAFHAVARLGSFAAAAGALHVTPSALSNLVRELEDAVGLRLLERTTRRVRLSAAGTSYYENAERVLRAVNDAKLCAEDLKRQLVGTVRVAATQIICWAVLPELLSAFRTAEPQVRVLVTDAKRSEIGDLLDDGHVDLGILPDYQTNDELHKELLLTAHTHLACNPAHPLAGHECIAWDELTDVPLISSGITAMLTRAELGKDLPIIVESELNFATSALGLVRANLGVALMPGYVESALNPSQVHMIRLVKPTIANRVVLCTIKGRELTPAAEIFRSFLLAHMTQAGSKCGTGVPCIGGPMV